MNILESIVNNKCVALKQTVSNWQEAVALGCRLLEEQGFVTKQYYKGILNATEKYGPYYVIAPNFAMPHARPEDGVNKLGFSLVTLQEGVCFGSQKNDPVEIVLTFAAQNPTEMNEQAIVEIMQLIEQDGILEAIKDVRDIDMLRHVI